MPSNKIRQNEQDLEEKIINYLKEQPLHPSELYRTLKLRCNTDHKLVKKILARLTATKAIVLDKGGLLRIASIQKQKIGRISITLQGFGFVSVENESKDIFIPAKHIASALDGDIVKVRILEDSLRNPRPTLGPVGIVSEIVERKRSYVVGELILKDYGFGVRPLNNKIPDEIRVSGGVKSAKRGDWVKANLIYDDKGRGKPVCEIVNSQGKAGKLENDINALIMEYNLLPPYTEEENQKALGLIPAEIKRKDLTSLVCVTIDPFDAKDFDDAISISPGQNNDEVLLGVHISDVAAWVQPFTWLDKEAAKRGFTSYIPGRTLPMLPKVLTRNISLRADKKDNFAHTVLITVNKTSGKILNYTRCHSIIKISKRLTFDEVEKYIKTNQAPIDWNENFIKNMDDLISLYKVMRGYRREHEQFLDIKTTEIRVLKDDNTGELLGIQTKKQGEADQLVEEFMLAGNSVMGRELTNLKLPGIYRVHPEPIPEKLDEFSSFLKEIFKINTGNLSASRKVCQTFLLKIEGNNFEEIITNAFLRSLTRALYAEVPSLHYGLGKGLYLHFTSPIRRYPDLIVHQQLLMYDLSEYKKLRNLESVKKMASACTEKEKNNDEAYFAANDRLKLHYLYKLLIENRLEVYEGIIRQVNTSGIFADISNLGISAFVPIKSLRDDVRRSRGKLVSNRGGHKQYKPGDLIYLQVEKIDFIKGCAIFKPIQY